MSEGKLRVLHTGDIHLGEMPGPVRDGKNARMQDTIACMQAVTQAAKDEAVDLILIDGDLTHKSKLWGDQTLREYQIIGEWLHELAQVATTVVLFGTRNHDSIESFYSLEKFKGTPDLYIVCEPKLMQIQTKKCESVTIGALPGLDKGLFRTQFPGMDPNTENQMCSDALADILRAWTAQMEPTLPAIFMGHYTVVGSEYDNGNSIFMESEVVLRPTDMDSSGFDLITLGHIHRAQRIEYCKKPAFYCGAINRISFNEEDQDKGIWIHDIYKQGQAETTAETDDYIYLYSPQEDGWCVRSRFIKTPARPMKTLFMGQDEVESIANSKEGIEIPAYPGIQDAIVRVKYECSAEVNRRFDRAKLEKALYAAGAFYVQEIVLKKANEDLSDLSDYDAEDMMHPGNALQAWLTEKGMEQGEYRAISDLAVPLIATVSAKQPTGKLTGIFEPISLTVKNYRSYREESFDFTKVRFATVNGPNGVGKSAFFSDAILDALYEEPREGDLAGWICSQEDVRSGSIEFVFRMGESKWRVSRTRTKGGKTTLALATWNPTRTNADASEWEDMSGDKKEQTQEKITALLGMDSMTFKSCVLIMQDAYAVFLEADKTERMKVLGDTMGLSIYDDLHEMAKKEITETNRQLRTTQDKIGELEKKIKDEAALEAEVKQIEDSLQELIEQMDTQDEELTKLKVTIQEKDQRAKEVAEYQKKIETLRASIASKHNIQKGMKAQIEQANELLTREEEILKASKEWNDLKAEIAVLKAKQPQQQEWMAESERVYLEQGRLHNEISLTEGKIEKLQITQEQKVEILAKAFEAKATEAKIEEMDRLAKEWRHAHDEVQTLSMEKTKIEKAGQVEIDKSETKIKVLEQKTAMLDSANCIDINRARCKFLKDALQAREDLKLENINLRNVKEKAHKDYDEAMGAWQTAVLNRDDIPYDDTKYKELKGRYQALKPCQEQAAKIEAQNQTVELLKGQLKDMEARLQDSERKAKLNIQRLEILKIELAPLQAKEIELKRLEPLATKKDQIPAAKQMLEMSTKRFAELEGEVQDITKEGQELAIKIKTIQEQIGDLEQLKAKMKAIETLVEGLQVTEKGYHIKLGAIKHQIEEIKQCKTGLIALKDLEKSQAKTVTRYQILAEAWSQDGIPFQIIKTIVPELQTTANSILGQMTGGKMEIEMKTERVQKSNKKEVNALEVWINARERGPLPYKSHSGGQKVKVALSTVFAIAHLKARRAGVQLGMLFVDEPPFLDEEGGQAYVDSLETMASRFTNMRIVAISHDPTMKARFPQSINVERTPEGSKVRFEG